MAWNTDYFWPLDGKVVVPIDGDLFGAPRDQGVHNGHDIIGEKVGTGQPFYAIHAGTVTVSTDNMPGWSQYVGSMIIIEDDGMQWEYQEFMAGSMMVKVGDTVKGGQPIGKMGRSGGAGSGEHLHLSMAKNFFGQSAFALSGWYDAGLYIGIPNTVGVFNRPANIGAPNSGGASNETKKSPDIIMLNIYNERKPL